VYNTIFSLLFFSTSLLYSQSDTIFTNDTLLSSIRVINQDKNYITYFYLDSKKKITKKIPIDSVYKVSYENDNIEVFCDLVSKKKFLGTSQNISINYGDRDSLWQDQKIFALTDRELKNFNTIIDALNFMGNEGWTTISSYSTSQNSYIVEHYILKKTIKK